MSTLRNKVVALHRAETRVGAERGGGLSDEALVAGIGVGDPAALGALYDRHHEAVARFVTRLTRAIPNDVDDIVHETFLVASSAAARFQGGSAVRTWLFGIAANVARHAVRAEGRRRALATAFGAVEPMTTRSPEDGTSDAELRERLADAIAALSHDLRVAFVLFDLEDVSGAEAARALGIPEGTLFRRCHEARRALRAALERDR
jgi:RNA polymerase sigma-70 factor (ECF subfamily)